MGSVHLARCSFFSLVFPSLQINPKVLREGSPRASTPPKKPLAAAVLLQGERLEFPALAALGEACAGVSRAMAQGMAWPRASPRAGSASSPLPGWVPGDGGTPSTAQHPQDELPVPGVMLCPRNSPSQRSSPRFSLAAWIREMQMDFSSGMGFSWPVPSRHHGGSSLRGEKSLGSASLQLLLAAGDAPSVRERRALCTQPFPESRSSD